MDRKYHIKQAENFVGKGSCYIHTEMQNGESVQRVISGDMISMLHCVDSIIDRISTLTNTGFEETVNAIRGLRMAGYSNVMQTNKDLDIDIVKDDTYLSDVKEAEEGIRNQYLSHINDLNEQLSNLTAKNNDLESQLRFKEDLYKNTLDAKNKQIVALTKECKVLDHRLIEMEKRNSFCIGAYSE